MTPDRSRGARRESSGVLDAGDAPGELWLREQGGAGCGAPGKVVDVDTAVGDRGERFFEKFHPPIDDYPREVSKSAPLEPQAREGERLLEEAIRRTEGTRTWSQPIEEEPRTANQEAEPMCVHPFSRVWRNKEGSSSLRSFTGSQPKRSCYRAPPYRRLPVLGQSLPKPRRSPPSGTTPSPFRSAVLLALEAASGRKDRTTAERAALTSRGTLS
ncbi:hypothetical protein KM043_008572 [Ampulex compressa]|nr:hypothetical protein KM043_008572 [Ampulex compressa]